MNYSIKKFKKITNGDYLNNFADTIYNNFLNLKTHISLVHNITKISKLLTSDHLIGYTVEMDNKIIGYLIGELMAIPDGRIVYYISYFYTSSKYLKYKTKYMGLKKQL